MTGAIYRWQQKSGELLPVDAGSFNPIKANRLGRYDPIFGTILVPRSIYLASEQRNTGVIEEELQAYTS